MKCHCKYCLPRFFCQTVNENDFCYYRHSMNINVTNDFGCIERDTAHFVCNTTDANYRTECCSSFFCNSNYQTLNGSIASSTSTVQSISADSNNTNTFSTIITIGTIFALIVLLIVIYYSYKRKFQIFWSTSFKSTSFVDDKRSFESHGRKKKSSNSFSIDYHSDTISWKSNLSDPHDQIVTLETRRMNKEITFLGQLGQGRHARVRLGRIGQQYRAIKMYEPRFQNEFERERAIFETDFIQHPNVLAFFGADFFAKSVETYHMLIFEWHPYGTLYDVLKENRNESFITIEQLLQYSISLSDGLAHLHSIKYGTNDMCKPKMAHCDIKSSNILVKLNGDCCLSDFSLAVRCDPQTQTILGGGIERIYHRVGTKLYMPPELLDKNTKFNFDRINAYQQGDMYSLALVLWEIGNCCCSMVHIRPYENQLPLNFNVENLIQLVCIEQKRPICCLNTSDQVLLSFFNLLDYYWCQDSCTRQSAANLQDQLRQLRPMNISF
ncbi:unnamed protein product [Rotaria socialis]|uniref:receptor protein serine/threonine kinase n=4 Tax=Rotaria socialis TaxID=392032 RepID=A0A819W312_9BILA|nr:unnamed protein product [Rotaria socialis]CAF3341631.1 unnamed protein product [Rotaria socialis]CAF3370557.1 unnamed protein product [Rotaria socialis]CAF3512004.1 unnamed protein product [Rotaria socialis]CAF4116580.1 unnamed protein product [Rotaria socialis]